MADQRATPGERAVPAPLPTDVAQVRTEIAHVRVEIANLDKRVSGEIADLRTEIRTGLADVRTEIAGVHTAIARLGEQHAKTEANRLRWTLGAIVAGTSLGVDIPRLLGA